MMIAAFSAQFDTQTLALLAAMAFALQSVVLVTFYLLANEYQGIGLAAVGNIIYGLGFGLVLFQDWLSGPQLLGLSIPLNLLGALLIAAGMAQFNGQRPALLWPGLGALLAALAAEALIFLRPDNNLRMAVVSLALALIFGQIGMILLRAHQPSYRTGAVLTAIAFLVYAGFLLLRAAGALLADRPQSLADNTPLQVLFFLLVFICSSLWTNGFLLMISQRLRADLHRLARRDPLTGLANRLEMRERLVQQAGGRAAFGILLLDIDYFKAVNDRYGHLVGDAVLQAVARRLTALLRPGDTLGRWGGEEFLVLLPGAAMPETQSIAERLRQALPAAPLLAEGGPKQVTISLGLAAWSAADSSVDDLLRRADAALYRAKQAGRNQAEES